MIIAYLAMPYRASTPNGIYENIQLAREEAVRLWSIGLAVYCPHMNTALMDGVVEDQKFLDFGLEMVNRCDIIVMGLGWRTSKGAIAEREYAISLNKLVFDLDEKDGSDNLCRYLKIENANTSS